MFWIVRASGARLRGRCNAFLTLFWPSLRRIVSDALRWRVREIINELLNDMDNPPIKSLVSLECNLGRRPIIVEDAWLSTGYASYDFLDLDLVVSLEGDTVEVVADVCVWASRRRRGDDADIRARSIKESMPTPRLQRG